MSSILVANETRKVQPLYFEQEFSSNLLRKIGDQTVSAPVATVQLPENTRFAFLKSVGVMFDIHAVPTGAASKLTPDSKLFNMALLSGENEVGLLKTSAVNDVEVAAGRYCFVLNHFARLNTGATAFDLAAATTFETFIAIGKEGGADVDFTNVAPNINKLVYQPTYAELFGTSPDGLVTEGFEFSVKVLAEYIQFK